ncbi:MAG: DUF2490 domain-containing protein [Crocinitomicaceae bacterium]
MKNLILLLFIGLISGVYAQDSVLVRDFESWNGISLKKSFLEKKLNLQLTQEFRFNSNSTRLNNYFTEIGADYEIIKGLEAGLGFRFIRNNTKKGYLNEQRFNADLSYKHKIDRLSLGYRFRYQNRNEIGVSKDDGDDPVSKYRFRLKVGYNIKNWKLDPYLSTEVFYATETSRVNYVPTITEVENIAGFQKLRFTLGTSYKINDVLKLNGFYRIERDFKTYPTIYYTPGTYHIAGINLEIKL